MNDKNYIYQELDTERFDELISQLKAKKSELETDLKHEYRKARRYVRANPERGIAGAFLAGICLGLLLSKLSDK